MKINNLLHKVLILLRPFFILIQTKDFINEKIKI